MQPEIVLEIECGLDISFFSSLLLPQTFLLLLNCFALFQKLNLQFFFDVGILYIDKGGFEPTIQPKPALTLQQSSGFLVLEF